MESQNSNKQKPEWTFGQIAIQYRFCTKEQILECIQIQKNLREKKQEVRLGQILVRQGYLTPDQVQAIVRLQGQSRPPEIAGYTILEKLGSGAMGAVYKARQLSMDRLVAVKVLAPRYAQDEEFQERFIREARATAKLNHINIIQGIDVRVSNGILFFAMEYVDGITLYQSLQEDGALDEQPALEILLQIARALEHAYRHHLVHRDIKPENIMITPDSLAKLCDFGLAKQITKAQNEERLMGTPYYIAPEQIRNDPHIDGRADIYSLGVTFYHILTGEVPFQGNSNAVMNQQLHKEIPSPKLKQKDLTEGACTILRQMTRKNPAERYQTPTELIADIEALLKKQSTPQPETPSPAEIMNSKKIRRHALSILRRRRR